MSELLNIRLYKSLNFLSKSMSVNIQFKKKEFMYIKSLFINYISL